MDHGAIGFAPNTGYRNVYTPQAVTVPKVDISEAVRSDTVLRRGTVRLIGGVGGVFQVASGSLKVQGVVRENSAPVARKVFMFRREDGLLLAFTTSSAVDGSFTLSTDFADEAFVVCLDDKDTPPEFNALIFDSVTAQ